MKTFGVYPVENFNLLDALVVSLLAVLIVFIILALIIGATSGVQKINDKVNYVTKINPQESNKILEEDKDAVIATLVATIDYHKEFNSDSKVVSIERIDEE